MNGTAGPSAGGSMVREVRRRIALLPRGARVRWVVLLPLGVATAAIEAVAAALVYGLIAALSGANVSHAAVVGRAAGVLARLGGGSLVVGLASAALVAHVVRSGVMWLTIRWRARVAGDAAATLSTRILGAYLAAPYLFHVRRNTSDRAQSVILSIPALLGLFDALTTLGTEVLVVLALAAVLCAVAPVETLIATAVIVAPLVPFVRLSRASYARFGARCDALDRRVADGLQKAFSAIKEVKVLGRERFFHESVARGQQERARAAIGLAALEKMPRLITESAFVAGMLVLVLVLNRGLRDSTQVLAFIGLYAYAGFRIIPAAHRIVLQLGIARADIAATAPLCDDLAEIGRLVNAECEEEPGPSRFCDAIRLEAVRYVYAPHGPDVLHGLDLEIRRGECVAIVGASGAGKSTLVDLILGLLDPVTGRILVDGVPVVRRRRAWQREIGYVPQDPVLVDDTLRRNIAFGIADEEIDETAVMAAVRVAQLEDLVGTVPGGLDTIVGERGLRLSGGERQRVSMARALYRDPDVLVLDEATSALDPGTEREVARAIDRMRADKTLIVIAHRMSTVERCDRVVFLRHGRIAGEGSYEELCRTSAEFRAMAAMEPTA